MGKSVNKERLFQYIGLMLMSLATLSLEVGMTRIFSVTFWYNFVFMIISIALLGSGASGVLLSFFKVSSLKKERVNLLMTITSVLFAAAIVFAFVHLNTIDLQPEDAFRDPVQLKNMIQYYGVLLIPFFFSGLTIGLLYARYSKNISRFYLFDLVGAGMGCLLILFLIPGIGGESTIFTVALFALAGAFFFSLNLKPWFPAGIALIAAFFLPHIHKAESYVNLLDRVHNKRTIDGNIEHIEWNIFSYCVVTDSPGRPWKGVNLDFACFTPIYRGRDGRIGNYYGAHAIPFRLLSQANKKPVIALIGSGGGREVQAGQDYNAKHIYAIEFNPSIVDMLQNRYAEYSGHLHDQPNVTLVEAEGRSFIRNSPVQFDLIVQNNTLTQTASAAGAYALAEDYVLTVEAFIDYLNKLNDGGILYVSQPMQLSIRMVSIAIEAFNRMGNDDIQQSIASMATTGGYTREFVMIKKGGFTEQETRSLRQMGNAYGLAIRYLPGSRQNTMHQQLLDAAHDPERLEALYESSYTEIRPSTDNWPFFSQRAKFKNVRHMISDLTRRGYARGRSMQAIYNSIMSRLDHIRTRLSPADRQFLDQVRSEAEELNTFIRQSRRFNEPGLTEFTSDDGTHIIKAELVRDFRAAIRNFIARSRQLERLALSPQEEQTFETIQTILGQIDNLKRWQTREPQPALSAIRSAAAEIGAGHAGARRTILNQADAVQSRVQSYNSIINTLAGGRRSSEYFRANRIRRDIDSRIGQIQEAASGVLLQTYIRETANEARGLQEALEIYTQWGYHDFRILENRLPQSLGVLVINLIQAVVFSTVLLLLPLLFFRRSGLKTLKPKFRFLIYFACLGFGFMFLEISLMQRFTLFLGHPIYAITTTLFIILIASGIGSYLSGKLPVFENPFHCIRFALTGVLVMTMAHILFVPAIFQAFLGTPMWQRIIISAIVLAPLGIFMGMFFPSGIRWASRHAKEAVPWAWAVNGFASVIGSVLTILIGMLWGFRTVILTSLVVYTIGVVLFLTIKEKESPA